MQHSYINESEVAGRRADYQAHGRDISWVVDGTSELEVRDLVNGHYWLVFRGMHWRYEVFARCGYAFIYVHAGDHVYRLDPSTVKSGMVDVRQRYEVQEWVRAVEDDQEIWDTTPLPQCTLYHNQRGAGCGKTYESLQLLCHDARFLSKTTFVYLTKMHSAKDVILQEFREQCAEGHLPLTDVQHHEAGRQYALEFTRPGCGDVVRVVIGTMDSFMYALGNKKAVGPDLFEALVNSIRNGYLDVAGRSQCARYAQRNVSLNKECLVVVDEAQDLPPSYVQAIAEIMRSTYIDVYVIGDKLQSLQVDPNTHTYLEVCELPHTCVVRSTGDNIVRRFHHPGLADVVNQLVPFSAFGLPPVSGVCPSATTCGYSGVHRSTDPALQVVLLRDGKDATSASTHLAVQQLVNLLDGEVNAHGYVPEDFLFIFPILTNNHLAAVLEAHLQTYWLKQFQAPAFCARLEKHSYWGRRRLSTEYVPFVIRHKSDEGCSINLAESEHATRISSIHAAKGTGRPVVFVIGLGDSALRCFGTTEGRLQYESLIHVAVTRPKCKLYIGLTSTVADPMYRRVMAVKGVSVKDAPLVAPTFWPNQFRNVPGRRVVQHMMQLPEGDFIAIDSALSLNDHKEQLLSITTARRRPRHIIDWGHHVIRYGVMMQTLMAHVFNHEMHQPYDEDTIEDDKWTQVKTQMNNIARSRITTHLYSEYLETLRQMHEDKQAKKPMRRIPVLRFDVARHTPFSDLDVYTNSIVRMMQHVSAKIRTGLQQQQLPVLCPLEAVLLHHMRNVQERTKFADITIMDVYHIMAAYRAAWSKHPQHDGDYACLCATSFEPAPTTGDASRDEAVVQRTCESIVHHHEAVHRIRDAWDWFQQYLQNFGGVTKFKVDRVASLDRPGARFHVAMSGDFVAQTSTGHLVHLLVTPQCSGLNATELVTRAALYRFLCLNDSGMRNHTLHTVVVSLDLDEPVVLPLASITATETVLMQAVSHSMESTLSGYHPALHALYDFCKRQPVVKGVTSLISTERHLVRQKIDPSSYVLAFLRDLNTRLTPPGTDRSVLQSSTAFIQALDEYLQNAIREFLAPASDANASDDMDMF